MLGTQHTFRLWLAATALLAGMPAVHAQDASSGKPADSPDAPPILVEGQAEKKICRMESSTGSIMPKRVCRTLAQMEEQQEAARMLKEQVRRQSERDRHFTELRRASGGQ